MLLMCSVALLMYSSLDDDVAVIRVIISEESFLSQSMFALALPANWSYRQTRQVEVCAG